MCIDFFVVKESDNVFYACSIESDRWMRMTTANTFTDDSIWLPSNEDKPHALFLLSLGMNKQQIEDYFKETPST